MLSDQQICYLLQMEYTIKFLNFRTYEKFAVKKLKFKKSGQTFGYANGIANSGDSDQTAPLIWVCTDCPDACVRKHRIITVIPLVSIP